MSNPFEPTDAAAPASPGGAGVGVVDEEGGWSVQQAFSIESVFSDGWKMLKHEPAIPIVAMLLIIAIQIALGVVQYGIDSVSGTDGAGLLAGQLVNMVLNFLAVVPTEIITAGALIGLGTVAQSGRAPLGTLVGHVREGIQLLIVSLLAGVILIAVMMVVAVPIGVAVGLAVSLGGDPIMLSALGVVLGIPALFLIVYVSLGLHLAPYACALDGLGPVEAIQVGWQKASGARMTLFALLLLQSVAVALAACLTLGIGAVVLAGVFMAGEVVAWCRVRRSDFMLFGDSEV